MKNSIKDIEKFLKENISVVFEKLGIECDNTGNFISCKCPIHDGDSDRSFSYYKNGKWICWTSNCHQEFGNDIFGLIRGVLHKKGEDYQFVDVLKWVTSTFNIKATGFVPNKEVDLLTYLQGIYSNNTTKPPEIDNNFKDVVIPSEYFVKQRMYDPKTLTYFNIGDSLLKTGISRYRAVIPVHNDDGMKVIANLYRSTKDWLEPKFLVDKSFQKTNYLYNYHRAAEKIKEKNVAFIVEGSGDVWRMYEAGVMNCVSLMGKEFSQAQRQKIDNLCVTNLIILLDNDTAGRESKTLIMRNLGRYYNLIFPRFSSKKDIGKMSPQYIKENILLDLKGYY